jgi:hypothetical protein
MEAMLRTEHGDEIDTARRGEQFGGLPKATVNGGRVRHQANRPAAEPRESLACENIESRERHAWPEKDKDPARPRKTTIFAFFLALRQGHSDTFLR